MKKCLAIAVLLLASSLTAAQAQYTFEYGGRTITHRSRSRHGLDSRRLRQYRQEGQALARRGRRSDRPGRKAPQQAKTAPQAAPEAAAPRGTCTA